MSSLHLNENIFFLVADRQFVIWDYQRHAQFALDEVHVCALLDFLAGKSAESNAPAVQDLIDAGVLRTSASSSGPWRWDVLARIFHMGTAFPHLANNDVEADPLVRSADYVERCGSIRDSIPPDAFRYEPGVEIATLAGLGLERESIDLRTVLARRISTRAFSGESIPLASIGEVLTETFFYRPHLVDKYEAKGLHTPTRRRSSASGGSLQCSEAYLVARNVAGLSSGIYHYRSHSDSLARIRAIDKEMRFGRDFLAGQSFSDDADAFIVITSRFDKMWWKYEHSRAYRVSCLDVGHLSQTAQLVATGLNLRTWVTAAFFDEDLRALLQIDTASPEYPLLVLGFGTGEVDPVDKYYAPPASAALA